MAHLDGTSRECDCCIGCLADHCAHSIRHGRSVQKCADPILQIILKPAVKPIAGSVRNFSKKHLGYYG